MTTAASFAVSPLTPTAFLHRSLHVFPYRIAVVDGDVLDTYAEFGRTAPALTGLLAGCGGGLGDRVVALCSNGHVMLELHDGVPLRGSVLVPLNIRLAPHELARILRF